MLRLRAASIIALAAAMPVHAADDADADKAANDPAIVRMVESKRVKDCATAVMEQRKLDTEGAFALMDKLPEADAMRANIHRLLIADTTTDKAEADEFSANASLGEMTTAYMIRAAGTFDLNVLARASAIEAVHLDRALGSNCNPSPDLLEYTGVPSRANR